MSYILQSVQTSSPLSSLFSLHMLDLLDQNLSVLQSAS